jgi:hypothetical protein
MRDYWMSVGLLHIYSSRDHFINSSVEEEPIVKNIFQWLLVVCAAVTVQTASALDCCDPAQYDDFLWYVHCGPEQPASYCSDPDYWNGRGSGNYETPGYLDRVISTGAWEKAINQCLWGKSLCRK